MPVPVTQWECCSFFFFIIYKIPDEIISELNQLMPLKCVITSAIRCNHSLAFGFFFFFFAYMYTLESCYWTQLCVIYVFDVVFLFPFFHFSRIQYVKFSVSNQRWKFIKFSYLLTIYWQIMECLSLCTYTVYCG